MNITDTEIEKAIKKTHGNNDFITSKYVMETITDTPHEYPEITRKNTPKQIKTLVTKYCLRQGWTREIETPTNAVFYRGKKR